MTEECGFMVGDWVEIIDESRHLPLGSVWQIATIDKNGWIYIENEDKKNWGGWAPSRFKITTPPCVETKAPEVSKAPQPQCDFKGWATWA